MGGVLDVVREEKKKRERKKKLCYLLLIWTETWTSEAICLDLLEEAFLFLFLEERDFVESFFAS